MNARRSLTVLVVAALLTLAGCGAVASGGSDGQATPSETQTSEVLATTGNGTLEVHFINVGQSTALLLVSPENETMLVDTGDFTDDGETVLAYLQREEIERLDHLVVSHNDADHIGGNAAVITYYETEAEGVGAVYDPGIAANTRTFERYLDAVEEHNVTLFQMRAGDDLPFAGVETAVLGPPDPYIENGERNENNIVLKLTHGRATFLLTGDAESGQEGHLVETYGSQLNASVLKAGHHGSNTSTGGPLLDAATPQVVVISSAYESRYGHPDPAVLQRLGVRSIPTYWTATHGSTVVTSNGTHLLVSTQRAAPTDPLRLREGTAVDTETADPVELRRVFVVDDADAGTPVATDGGEAGTLSVASVHADADGDDRENLNDEYVVFENTGSAPLDLGGWTVTDEADHSYTFPAGVTVDAGERVTLRTGSGDDTDSDLYWGASSPVWNNGGDTVFVRTDAGDLVLEHTYE